MKKVFSIPLPVYSNEVGIKSNKMLLASSNISRSQDKTRKAKRQTVLTDHYPLIEVSNPQFRIYNRPYYTNNRLRIISEQKKRNKKNLAKIKLHRLKYDKIRYHRSKNKLFDLLGRKCVRCGFDDIRGLQFDHIKGGGIYDQQRFKGSSRAMYDYYLDNITLAKRNLQVLCANCNWIKRHENNEFKRK
jgi:hypothetical protein